MHYTYCKCVFLTAMQTRQNNRSPGCIDVTTSFQLIHRTTLYSPVQNKMLDSNTAFIKSPLVIHLKYLLRFYDGGRRYVLTCKAFCSNQSNFPVDSSPSWLVPLLGIPFAILRRFYFIYINIYNFL